MVDRFKDIVKSGGENVSSIRVESVLYGHPAVEKAAVIGLPHDHWGEAVTAVVVLRPEPRRPRRTSLRTAAPGWAATKRPRRSSSPTPSRRPSEARSSSIGSAAGTRPTSTTSRSRKSVRMIDGHRGWSGRGRDPAEAERAIAVKCGTSPSAAPPDPGERPRSAQQRQEPGLALCDLGDGDARDDQPERGHHHEHREQQDGGVHVDERVDEREQRHAGRGDGWVPRCAEAGTAAVTPWLVQALRDGAPRPRRARSRAAYSALLAVVDCAVHPARTGVSIRVVLADVSAAREIRRAVSLVAAPVLRSPTSLGGLP